MALKTGVDLWAHAASIGRVPGAGARVVGGRRRLVVMADLAPFDLQRHARGAVHRGVHTVDVGFPLELPYLAVRGAAPGRTLLVTAGVHGAEYASIEAAYRLADLDPAALRGDVLVFPILCPPAFFARTVYVNPIDGENLNRMFPGDPQGTFARRLAHVVTTDLIGRCDAYVDLHGGDLIEALHPFTIYPADHAPSRAMAEAFGIETLVASRGSGMTYAAAAARGVPAILAEAGGQGLRPEPEVARLVDGVLRVLVHLGMQDGALAPRATTALDTFAWLRSEQRGLWYPEVAAGARVSAGQPLGRVTDLLGRPLQHVVAPIAGIVLFVVSSLAILVDDPLLGLGA